MNESQSKLGLVGLSGHAYGYFQKDKGLGWSNAGLIAGRDNALLVDTLFDLSLTRTMLAEIAGRVGKPIKRVVNTHHNGDHCWGNQLVAEAEIIGHSRFREEMLKMPPEMTQALKSMPAEDEGAAALQHALAPFDFSGIELTPPTLLFDENLTLFVGELEVRLLHVGPAHTSTDVIVYVPQERVLYAGDIIFRLCTPIGWEGTFEKWIQALNRIIEINPDQIVPGHGPLCGIEGAVEMREYFQYVYREARSWFERGASPAEAAKSIDPGPYAGWTEPERIIFNVSRAYREFKQESPDTPIDLFEMAETMAAIRRVRG